MRSHRKLLYYLSRRLSKKQILKSSITMQPNFSYLILSFYLYIQEHLIQLHIFNLDFEHRLKIKEIKNMQFIYFFLLYISICFLSNRYTVAKNSILIYVATSKIRYYGFQLGPIAILYSHVRMHIHSPASHSHFTALLHHRPIAHPPRIPSNLQCL